MLPFHSFGPVFYYYKSFDRMPYQNLEITVSFLSVSSPDIDSIKDTDEARIATISKYGLFTFH